MNNIFVDQSGAGQRLDNFVLMQNPEVSRSHIKNQIEKGCITLNGKTAKSGEKLKIGDTICINFEKPQDLDAKPENISINTQLQP